MEKTKPFTISKGQVMLAFELVKANAGAAGVDHQSINDFEDNLKGNLYKLWNRLSSGSYFPPPVKAVAIPKKSGGERVLGVPTPQGGVISPILANLYLHYVIDKWLQKHYLEIPWCRYADDGLLHCNSEGEAKALLEVLRRRFHDCGLELHPEKTKIVYCKDGARTGSYKVTEFDFLGYGFRRRISKNRYRNSLFLNFTPAVSKSALKAMRFKIRKLGIRSKTNMNIAQIAKWLNPLIDGWIQYYGRSNRSSLYAMCRHLSKALVRWARRKYKSLRRHKTKAVLFMESIAKQSPKLFAHWRRGMVGAFA